MYLAAHDKPIGVFRKLLILDQNNHLQLDNS